MMPSKLKIINSVIAIAVFPLLLSCTTAQLEQTKAIASKTMQVTVSSLPLLARVATAYGAPYAEIVTAFAKAANPKAFEEEGESDMEGDFSLYDQDEDGIVDDEFDLDSDGIPDELSEENSSGEEEMMDEEPADEAQNTLVAEVDIIQELQQSNRNSSRSVKDGDQLDSSDNYKMKLGCNIDCYAYVAQLDATGRMDPIIPSEYVNFENLLLADESYSLPSDDKWFFLDENKGLEQIYFIFSLTPREDIREIFSELAASNRNLVQRKKVSIQEKMTLTRGIAGIREGQTQAVVQSNGDIGEYISTVINASGADLVLTRWFKHL